MDGGTWQATVHGVAKSWTRLSGFTWTWTLADEELPLFTVFLPMYKFLKNDTCILDSLIYDFIFPNTTQECRSNITTSHKFSREFRILTFWKSSRFLYVGNCIEITQTLCAATQNVAANFIVYPKRCCTQSYAYKRHLVFFGGREDKSGLFTSLLTKLYLFNVVL